MRFVMFVIDNETRSGSPEEMKAINTFNERMLNNGHWVMAFGIEAPGPDSTQNTDAFYSGIWIIEAADLSEAQNLTAQAAAACNRRVELRPFL